MGLDCKVLEFPFLMFFQFLVLMHVWNVTPSRNTSHSFTVHFATYKPLQKFHSTFCVLKVDREFVRVVPTARSASGAAFYLSAQAEKRFLLTSTCRDACLARWWLLWGVSAGGAAPHPSRAVPALLHVGDRVTQQPRRSAVCGPPRTCYL